MKATPSPLYPSPGSARSLKNRVLITAVDAMAVLWKHAYPAYALCYRNYKRIADRELVRLIRATVRPGMTVLDIGANIGFFTMILSDGVGADGTVHAFEPEPLNCTRLRHTVRARRNVAINQCAVAQKSGTIRLYLSDRLGVDHQTYDSGQDRSSIEVRSVSIDEYLPATQAVDFVKLDIQGFEYYALRGMQKTIGRSLSVCIVGEFWPYGIWKSGSSPEECLDLLAAMGLQVSFFGGTTADYWRHRPAEDRATAYIIAAKAK